MAWTVSPHTALTHDTATTLPAARSHTQLIPASSDCNFELETKVPFDPARPAGVYTLEMNKPYDKTVAQDILRLAADLPGCTIARVRKLKTTLTPVWW